MRFETEDLEVSENEILEIKYHWHDPSFDHAFGTERLPKVAMLESFRVIHFEGTEGERIDATDLQSPGDLKRLEKIIEKHLQEMDYESGV